MASLLPVEDARARLLSDCARLPEETVAVAEALGRTLAGDVTARHDQPRRNISAMDGYAVPADLGAGTHLLTVSRTIAAGEEPGAPLSAGETARIYTGGGVPEGGRVVVQEQAERDGDEVRLAIHENDATHVRPAGGDFAAGAVLARAGECVGGPRLALIAAADRAGVRVVRRPRVGILASGDELAPPGSGDGARIANSAAYGVAGLVEDWGGRAEIGPILPDDLDTSADALSRHAHGADILVTIGGASVGDRDVLRAAAERAGYALDFAGVAVRPGKPLWSANADGRPRIVGLPGNPASALATARLFLVPLLLRLGGRDEGDGLAVVSAKLAAELGDNGSRESYHRARLAISARGEVEAYPALSQDSSLLTPFVEGAGLIRRAVEAPPADIGALVDVLPVRPLGWNRPS